MLNALAAAAALLQVPCPFGFTVPAGQTCPLPDPFFLFFDWDSSEITPASAAILDAVIALFRRAGSHTIAISSHADRAGSVDYNLRLTRRRAERVRRYLVTRGIPERAIATVAFGESRPLVDTADGVREPQNRLVQIVLVPPQD